MKLSKMHFEAIHYVDNGGYRMIGGSRPELSSYIRQLRDQGYLRVSPSGPCAKLSLTIKAKSIIGSLT